MRVKLLVATAAMAALGVVTLGGVAAARGGHGGGFHGGGFHGAGFRGGGGGAAHTQMMSRSSGAMHVQTAVGVRSRPIAFAGQGWNARTSVDRSDFDNRQFHRPPFEGARWRRVGRDDHDDFERDHMRHFDRDDGGRDRRFFNNGFGGVGFGLNYYDGDYAYGGDEGGDYGAGYGPYPTDDYAPNDYPSLNGDYAGAGDEGGQQGYSEDESSGGGYYDAGPHDEVYYYRHVGGGVPESQGRSWRRHHHRYKVRACTCRIRR